MPAPELEVQPTPQEPEAPWNPPTGDSDWDSLFSGDEGALQPQAADAPEAGEATTPEPEPAPEARPTAPAPKTDDFFLKMSTGTVYKNKDEAIRGFEEKDRALEDLRGKVIALTGVDPLQGVRGYTGKPQAPQPVNYLQDSDRYAKDLTEAALSKQYQKYRDTQLQLFDEYLQTRYGHILPVVEKVGRQEALDSVATENPAFKSFYGSEDYTRALESRPALKRAIQAAESDPRWQSDLPDLYKLVYDTSLASKTPELVSKGSTTTPQNPPSRMPISTATHTRAPLNVPDARSAPSIRPGMDSSAGRKALMRELEAKGVLDQQI